MQNLYEEKEGFPIKEILEVLSVFPTAFSEDMNKVEEVTEEEVLGSLSSMKKGESSGHDGLFVQFYMGFYDLLKEDLFKIVRESKSSSKVLGPLNSTFIALIPKKQKGLSFSDYMPITCCNVIYKIISKIIALRLKHILSTIISEEQLEFLQGRQIHDVVLLTQGALHSIKTLKQLIVILKVDLSKACDKVN